MSTAPSFRQFYTAHYLPEHQHPLNIALHCVGTLLGLAWLPAMWVAGWPWAMLLFPVVHAAPGLIGHRVCETNVAVGHARVTRTDFPFYWFIVANHLLLARVMVAPLRRLFLR